MINPTVTNLCHLVFFSGFTRLYNQVQGQAAKKVSSCTSLIVIVTISAANMLIER